MMLVTTRLLRATVLLTALPLTFGTALQLTAQTMHERCIVNVEQALQPADQQLLDHLGKAMDLGADQLDRFPPVAQRVRLRATGLYRQAQNEGNIPYVLAFATRADTILAGKAKSLVPEEWLLVERAYLRQTLANAYVLNECSMVAQGLLREILDWPLIDPTVREATLANLGSIHIVMGDLSKARAVLDDLLPMQLVVENFMQLTTYVPMINNLAVAYRRKRRTYKSSRTLSSSPHPFDCASNFRTLDHPGRVLQTWRTVRGHLSQSRYTRTVRSADRTGGAASSKLNEDD